MTCLITLACVRSWHGTKKIVRYSRFFALAKQSEPRGSLGRRLFTGTVKPHYKNFMTCLDIERVRYCPQHRESVNMKTFDTRMVSQNGSIKGMSLGSAASTTSPPPLQATTFSFLTLFFALFPHCEAGSRLSKFGQ